MSTQKQKKVAKLVIENLSLDKPLNGGQILEKTGYAPGVVKNPKDILQSEGVQNELKVLGFDPQKAKEVVAEILQFGENDTVKLKAADMIFKVSDTYAPEKKKIEGSLDITEPSDRIKELAKKLRDAI